MRTKVFGKGSRRMKLNTSHNNGIVKIELDDQNNKVTLQGTPAEMNEAVDMIVQEIRHAAHSQEYLAQARAGTVATVGGSVR
jgi:cell division protein ZapA (FtsZ GTPase activity inhibitor)